MCEKHHLNKLAFCQRNQVQKVSPKKLLQSLFIFAVILFLKILKTINDIFVKCLQLITQFHKLEDSTNEKSGISDLGRKDTFLT